MEDLREDGTETGPDRENPEGCRQDTRTDRTNIFRSPRRSRCLSRYHEMFRDWADSPEIQKTVKLPQKTQRGQRPRVAGQTQRGSEPRGPDKIQRGQSPEG